MGRFLLTRNDVEYTGIDIVPDLIKNHQAKFTDHNDWNFIHTDILVNPLQKSYDIILCRMLLQHLVTADIVTMLKRFTESKSSYLLATTFSEYHAYQEVLTDSSIRFRYINLEIPPFSLVVPICYSRDGPNAKVTCPSCTHYLGLWKLPLQRFISCQKSNLVKYTMGTKNLRYSCQ